MFKKSLLIFGSSFFVPLLTTNAQFSDVLKNDPQYMSIAYLTEQNIFNGYEDGTFKPDNKINRVAALKTILIAAESKINEALTGKFLDVPTDQWFAKYVESAATLGIVSGDAKTGMFNPGREVNKAEFLKMLLKAFEIDVSEYTVNHIAINDVPQEAWFAPYFQFAHKFGILKEDADNNVYPGKILTRKESAKLIFAIMDKGHGLSPQKFLNLTEKHLIDVVASIEETKISKAGMSIIAAESFINKTVKMLPDNEIVLSAEKITKSLKNLVGAYSAGENSRPEDVVTSSKLAWKLADESLALNPKQEKIVSEIKQLSGELANKARTEIEARRIYIEEHGEEVPPTDPITQ